MPLTGRTVCATGHALHMRRSWIKNRFYAPSGVYNSHGDFFIFLFFPNPRASYIKSHFLYILRALRSCSLGRCGASIAFLPGAQVLRQEKRSEAEHHSERASYARKCEGERSEHIKEIPRGVSSFFLYRKRETSVLIDAKRDKKRIPRKSRDSSVIVYSFCIVLFFDTVIVINRKHHVWFTFYPCRTVSYHINKSIAITEVIRIGKNNYFDRFSAFACQVMFAIDTNIKKTICHVTSLFAWSFVLCVVTAHKEAYISSPPFQIL